MSKRNKYIITISDTVATDEIIQELEKTNIVVERKQNSSDDKLVAKDAIRPGEVWIDGPTGYLFWRDIKPILNQYIGAIDKVRHELADDTACNTNISEYAVQMGEFVKVHEETVEGY